MAENKLLRGFIEQLKLETLEKVSPAPYSDWMTKNTKVDGAPMSFSRHHFQIAIINDLHPNMDVIKCSQIGLTEVQYRKALAIAKRNPNRVIIFTLPDEDMVKKLAQTRVQPLLQNNSIFYPEGDEKPVRSVNIVQIGESFVIFTPANEKAATSQPADAVFNDEVDLSKSEILALFNSRMQDSDWKMNQRFSTPTFTGTGISLSYEQSDQRQYVYKCHACGYRQIPAFTKEYCTVPNMPESILNFADLEYQMLDKYSIDISKAYMHCKKCKAPMDLKRADLREWVAKYPNRTHHRGYKVTPFCVSSLPPEYILSQLFIYKRNNFLRGWYNTVLGEAYEGGSERLSKEDVLAAFTGEIAYKEYDSDYQHFIGVDMGQTCNIVVGRARGLHHIETALFETCHVDAIVHRVKELKDRYRIVKGHVDRQPYEPTAQEILMTTDQLVVPCEYGTTDRYMPKTDKQNQLSHVRVNRTMQIDQVVEYVTKGRISFSGYGTLKETIEEHLRDMVRKEEAERPAVWEKLTGNDHFFHSLGYMIQAVKQFYDGGDSGRRKGSTIHLGSVSSSYKPQNLAGGA